MPATAILSDDDWFTATVERYERPLVAYALRYVHDLETARDMVQDVFVKLHAELPTDRAGMAEKIAQWLFTVCRNRCIDHQRSHAVSRRDSMDFATQSSPVDSPEAAFVQAETTTQVLAALAQLPPRQQEVIRLKFHQGLSYADIAAVTELSVTNVGFLISTGLATVRQKFMPLIQQEGQS